MPDLYQVAAVIHFKFDLLVGAIPEKEFRRRLFPAYMHRVRMNRSARIALPGIADFLFTRPFSAAHARTKAGQRLFRASNIAGPHSYRFAPPERQRRISLSVSAGLSKNLHMTNSGRSILVTGATGRQGGAVTRHLLKNNFTVKALSRTPESISAQLLASEGITVIKGDMSDPRSLLNAMKGCDGVFSIQNYFEYGAEKEIQYGRNMADAAKESKISHFIYNSVCNADTHTGLPHFESKNSIEQYIRSIGLPATILRPVKFMENYYIPQVFKGILGGKLFDPIKAGKKHQMIAVDDIGAYVAAAFLNPEKYTGQVIEMAGEELTNEQIAATMSQVMGRKVKFKKLPLIIARLAMDKEMYLMFRWFGEKGFTADIETTRRTFPSVDVTSLKNWLANEGWQRWNKKGSI